MSQSWSTSSSGRSSCCRPNWEGAKAPFFFSKQEPAFTQGLGKSKLLRKASEERPALTQGLASHMPVATCHLPGNVALPSFTCFVMLLGVKESFRRESLIYFFFLYSL